MHAKLKTILYCIPSVGLMYRILLIFCTSLELCYLMYLKNFVPFTVPQQTISKQSVLTWKHKANDFSEGHLLTSSLRTYLHGG